MTRRSTLLAATALMGALLGCEHAVAGARPETAKKPAPASKAAATPTPADVAFAPTPAHVANTTDEIPRIAPPDAAAAVAAGTAVIVDVREDANWDAGHVKGALHLPLREIEAKHLDTLPHDKRIIAYCS